MPSGLIRHAMSIATGASLTLITALSSTSALGGNYADDDKVSTMKGQLVEVGDRNRYHYDFPRYNVSINPFGIVSGTYGISSSYALTDNVAVRGDLNYTEALEDQASGYELGLGAQVFFKKMYSGIYLEPGVVRIHRDDGDLADDYDAFGPQVLLGYSWFWDSGFNVSLAAGAGRNLMKSDGHDDEPADEEGAEASTSLETRTFGNGYLRVGYAF